MFQIVKKWKIIVNYKSTSRTPLSFDIYDNHLGNVFQLLSKLDFGNEIHMVTINPLPEMNQQESVTTA